MNCHTVISSAHLSPPQPHTFELPEIHLQVADTRSDPGAPHRIQQRRTSQYSTLAENNRYTKGTHDLYKAPAGHEQQQQHAEVAEMAACDSPGTAL